MDIMGDMLRRATNRLESAAVNKISEGVSKKLSGVPSEQRCPKCREKLQNPIPRFCSKCGAQLFATCAKCKKDYSAGTKFCSQCGGELGMNA